MTHGSLFSGIGGFDLAASWLGWDNIFQCEIDPFCQKILKYHFPKSKLYEDITKTDFTQYRGTIDVLSGGFPCQPFSLAGKKRGTEDDRFLWPEMLRAIREIEPTWVVAENVCGLITQQRGVVFEGVQTDLEAAGYEVQPLIIPACAVDAPHRRDRVWIVAYRTNAGIKGVQQRRENGICETGATADTDSIGCGAQGTGSNKRENSQTKRESIFCEVRRFDDKQIAPNTQTAGQPTRQSGQAQKQFGGGNGRMGQTNDWADFPTQSPICSRNDGLSDRLDSIAFPAWRRKSIEAYGNAIVPKIAYQIFKAINEIYIN